MKIKLKHLSSVIFVLILSPFGFADNYEFYFDAEMLDIRSDQYGDVINIEGCHLSGQPGSPFLPVWTGHLTAAFGTEITDIRVVSEDWTTLSGTFDIRPAPTQIPLSSQGPVPEIFRNELVYSSNKPFPAQSFEFSSTGLMRGYPLGGFRIYPVRYFPESKRVDLLNRIELRIEYRSSDTRYNPTAEFGSAISRFVENSEYVYYQNLGLLSPDEVKYLIITAANYKDAFQPLADWHTAEGLPAEIISIDEILSRYEGSTIQLKIKSCIHDYAENKGTIYVLLGGDDQIVPDQNCWASSGDGGTIDNTMPTDLFYACFDNDFNWNSDNDGLVGEYADNIDLYPEIFISRAPIRTNNDAITFVDKTLNYIHNPASVDFVDPMLLSGVQLWDTWGGRSDAERKTERMWYWYIEPNWPGHNRAQFYDTNTDFGGPSYEVNYQNLSERFNNGYNYMFMATHGSQTIWSMEQGPAFNSAHALNLTNSDQQGLIYTIACITNGFDSEGSYTIDPCLSEGFIRNSSGGAIAYQGCSRFGWGWPQTDDHGASFLYADAFFSLLFSGNTPGIAQGHHYRLGAVAASHKALRVPECDDAIMRWVNYGTNSIGDPALDLLTDNPTNFRAFYPTSITVGSSEYTVMDIPNGTKVCLRKDDEIYEVGEAFGGGATLTINPVSPGIMNMTVSGHNFYPLIDEIEVTVSSGPYMVIDSCLIDDQGGNIDGNADFGETIVLGIGLCNAGPESSTDVSASLLCDDEYVSVIDSIESFGNIAGDSGSAFIGDAFQIHLSPNIPDNYLIDFEIEITDVALNSWTDNFSISASAPAIEFGSFEINDQSGNDNGILDPGETAELVTSLLNLGSSAISNVMATLSENDPYIEVIDSEGSFGDIPANGGIQDNSENCFVVSAESNMPQQHPAIFNMEIQTDIGFDRNVRFVLQDTESFENDNGGWVGEFYWQHGNPTTGPEEAYDGANVFGTLLDANYPNDVDIYLTAAPMTITNSEAEFSFYHWYSAEYGYDGGNIQITNDGGETWSLIFPEGGYRHRYIAGLDNEPGFTGNSNGWQQVHIDLSPYVNETIQLRFRFGSDGFTALPGWYIDFVTVRGGVNWASFEPEIDVSPQSLTVYMNNEDTETRELVISNDGEGLLQFEVSATYDIGLQAIETYQPANPESVDEANVEKSRTGLFSRYSYTGFKRDSEPEFPLLLNSGGPDAFGYTWSDSDEPDGPDYNWVDISGVGTEIEDLGDDVNIGPFDVGFEFRFYGQTFNTFRLCSNGWISFTSSQLAWEDYPLPNTVGPFNLIAPLWDDLDLDEGSQVFYYSSPDSLIISFVDVHSHDGGDGPYSFQIVLFPDGNILFQYLNVSNPSPNHTIGIQNSDGNIGLEIACGENYIHSNLAVLIEHPEFWLVSRPGSGYVFPYEYSILNVTFNSAGLPDGQYICNLDISSNDPLSPLTVVPCTLHVVQTSVEESNHTQLPANVMLMQNYPNPFNPATTFKYVLPRPGKVRLEVFNLLGQRVTVLVDEYKNAGYHSQIWKADNLPSGVYFFRLTVDEFSETKKMLLVK